MENKEENQVPVEQPANPVEIQISEPINVPEEKSVSDIVTPAEEKPKKKSFFGMLEFQQFNRSPSSSFHLEEPPLWLVHIACACVQLAFGLGTVVGKSALEAMPALIFAFYRELFAGIILFVLCVRFTRLSPIPSCVSAILFLKERTGSDSW